MLNCLQSALRGLARWRVQVLLQTCLLTEASSSVLITLFPLLLLGSLPTEPLPPTYSLCLARVLLGPSWPAPDSPLGSLSAIPLILKPSHLPTL